MRAFAPMPALAPSGAFGQSTAAKPAFEIADVHAVPRTNQPTQGDAFRDGRYAPRRTTMVDPIRTALRSSRGQGSGEPSWLEYNPFDGIAKAPAGTSPEIVRLMLH